MIGRTLEHYRIESKLGEGGMGVVYKAHDARLDRPVAIKLLPPATRADPAAIERFVREAKAASALNHPGVVTIHDIRSADGTDFIVMEWIDGKTLGERIPPQGTGPAQALRFAVQIADALAATHDAGILHRDLKPSNVMVTKEGRIKILDFGLAKLVEATDASSATTRATLTAGRMLVGTAAYMSPEQAEGRTLDARSDIFSLGVVLYEMATGRRPFTGDSAVAVLAKVLHDEPMRPTAINAAIPVELEKTILRCVRKNPDRRYQTMADLKVALEDLEADAAAGDAVLPGRGGGARIGRWVWAATVPLALAAGYAGRQEWRAAEPVAPVLVEALTTLAGQELYPSLAPDGNYVAFTWTGPKQDNADVYVQQIGVGSPLRVTTDARSEYNPVWSPDGRWLAFLRGDPARPLDRSDREVRISPPLGGPDRKLADIRVQEVTTNPVYLDWCPDSTCVIVTDTTGEGRPDALFAIALDSGEKRQLTVPQPPVLADTNPAVAADGRSLLFLRRTTWASGDLHLVRLRPDMTADGDATRVTVPGLRPENVAWLPNGNEILVATPAFAGGAALWRVPVAGNTAPARLPFAGEDGVMPTFSRAQAGRPARLVYVRSFTDENIWRIDTSATGAAAPAPSAVAIASTKPDIHPQLSPDRRRVAFTSTRSGAWEIWVSDLDGGNALQISSLRAPTGTGVPHWSPDGTQIVFASDAEAQFDIFLVPAGGGKPRNITSHPAMEHVPSFSADGRWIYFSSNRTGQFQVWRAPVSGGEPVQVTKDGGWIAQESPDGVSLYFTASPAIGAQTPVWRMPRAGGPAVKVVEAVLNGGFCVVERGIYYIGHRSTKATLQFFDFAGRRSVTIAPDTGDVSEIGGVTASADGRIILYARRDSAVDDLMLAEGVR